jgi:iron complex outermembrane receptor protein
MNARLLASAVVALAVGMPVYAREEASIAVAAADASALEEIVVTAQKRTERAQEVPKQVQVLNVEDLAAAGVSQIADLGAVSPSIAGGTSLNGLPSIRGISSFAFSIGVQAQTGIVIDDIPQPTFSTLANDLSDIQRVEVLAGPQSTLSGRNAAGGLINIVTRAPSDEWEADASVEATTDNQVRGTAFVSGPISSDLSFSLSGVSNDWDGPVENVTDGDHALGYDVSGVRGKLRFDVSDRTVATLTGYYHESTYNRVPNGGGPYVLQTGGTLFGQTFAQRFPGINAEEGNQQTRATTLGSSKAKNKGTDLRLEFDLGAATLTSISSISKYDRSIVDYFAPIPGGVARQGYFVDYKTQEFRLTSNGDNRLQYLLGAVYYDTETFFPYHRVGFAPIDRDLTTDIKNLALFGRATYELADGTFLTGGLRVARDRYGFDSTFRPIAGGQATLNQSKGDEDFNFIAGEASVRHQLSKDTNIYLTLARGESGKVYDMEDTSSLLAGNLKALDSQTVWNVETGIKAQSSDRRWTANLNAFFARYSNYQIQSLQVVDQNTLPVIRLFTIGEVETKGLEFSGNFRAADNLNLTLNAIYLDAKINDYPNADCYRFQTSAKGCNPVTGRQDNLAGKTLPSSSKFRVSFGADTTFITGLPVDFTAGAFVRWQSSSNSNLFGDPALRQDAYAVVNLTGGVQTKDERIAFEVFVNNLFDEVNYASLTNETFWTSPHISATYNRDSFRYAGARLNVKF